MWRHWWVWQTCWLEGQRKTELIYLDVFPFSFRSIHGKTQIVSRSSSWLKVTNGQCLHLPFLSSAVTVFLSFFGFVFTRFPLSCLHLPLSSLPLYPCHVLPYWHRGMRVDPAGHHLRQTVLSRSLCVCLRLSHSLKQMNHTHYLRLKPPLIYKCLNSLSFILTFILYCSLYFFPVVLFSRLPFLLVISVGL